MSAQGSLFDAPEGRSTVSAGRSLSRDTATRVFDDKGAERCAACYSRVSAFGRCPRCARIGARALELVRLAPCSTCSWRDRDVCPGRGGFSCSEGRS